MGASKFCLSSLATLVLTIKNNKGYKRLSIKLNFAIKPGKVKENFLSINFHRNITTIPVICRW